MKLFDRDVPDELYVVIVENDAGKYAEEGVKGYPIAWETRLTEASFESALRRRQTIATDYGRTRIAKLTLLEDTQ